MSPLSSETSRINVLENVVDRLFEEALFYKIPELFIFYGNLLRFVFKLSYNTNMQIVITSTPENKSKTSVNPGKTCEEKNETTARKTSRLNENKT